LDVDRARPDRDRLAAATQQDAGASVFELPRALACAADGDDDVDPAQRKWMAGLPAVVDDLACRWTLQVGRPFQPGGSASWVAPARTAAGESVVLKAGWRHDEALHEADGLRAWQGQGAVRLLGSLVTATTCALLLEACEPGTPLSQALPEREQDAVVAGLLRRLWIEPPAGHQFRSLQAMCDRWAGEFDESYAAARARGQDQLDPGLARTGIELFRQLPGTAGRSVLLCTDLHHDNVLAATREPWLVIDPKPYIGDPAYDPLQHMLNFPGRLVTDPGGFADRMAGLLGLDPERLRHWLFARCVQESVGEPHLRTAAIRLAP
jgi:streptomycin 6-kinase